MRLFLSEKEAGTFARRNKGGDVTQEEKGEEDHGFTEDRTPAVAAHTALGCCEDQALLETVKMDVTEKTKRGTGVPELPGVRRILSGVGGRRGTRCRCWPASQCPGLFYDLRAGTALLDTEFQSQNLMLRAEHALMHDGVSHTALQSCCSELHGLNGKRSSWEHKGTNGQNEDHKGKTIQTEGRESRKSF